MISHGGEWGPCSIPCVKEISYKYFGFLDYDRMSRRNTNGTEETEKTEWNRKSPMNRTEKPKVGNKNNAKQIEPIKPEVIRRES